MVHGLPEVTRAGLAVAAWTWNGNDDGEPPAEAGGSAVVSSLTT